MTASYVDTVWEELGFFEFAPIKGYMFFQVSAPTVLCTQQFKALKVEAVVDVNASQVPACPAMDVSASNHDFNKHSLLSSINISIIYCCINTLWNPSWM